MADWKLTINVEKEFQALINSKEDFDPEEDVPREKLQRLVDKLREFNEKVVETFNQSILEEYQDYVNKIEDSVTVEDFDSAWGNLYDAADVEKIWIKTDEI